MRMEALDSVRGFSSSTSSGVDADDDILLQIGGFSSAEPSKLSIDDSLEFRTMLDAQPRQPTERMRRAFERHRRMVASR